VSLQENHDGQFGRLFFGPAKTVMWSHPKPERIRDEALKAEVKAQGCVVKNRDCSGGADPHHVKTRGAGGDDRRLWLMPLCRFHHVEIGTIGVATFIEKYGLVFSEALLRWTRS
jgi:hypothetical protein